MIMSHNIMIKLKVTRQLSIVANLEGAELPPPFGRESWSRHSRSWC